MKRLSKLNPFEQEEIPPFPTSGKLDHSRIVWENDEDEAMKLGYGKYRDYYRGRRRPELLPAEPILYKKVSKQDRKPVT